LLGGGGQDLLVASGEGVILLDAVGFGIQPVGSQAGVLTPGGAPRVIVAADGRAAAEAGEWQFVFDSDDLVLAFDANGIGGGGRGVLARLAGGSLTATDIVVG
jgi:hypothetical protein